MAFWDHVEKTPTCWLWNGSINKAGYGRVGSHGIWLAHRQAWQLLRGPIPEGLTLDHLCRVRRCVNPDHLEPVSMRENILRGISFAAVHAAQTECAHGHPFDEANTGRDRSRGGSRVCRACDRRRHRELAARRQVVA